MNGSISAEDGIEGTDLRFFVVGAVTEDAEEEVRWVRWQCDGVNMHRRQEVWGLKGGIVAPDVTGGVHALRVNAGMALDGAFPPRVHVFLQVQNLKMLPSNQRKMCDVSCQR